MTHLYWISTLLTGGNTNAGQTGSGCPGAGGGGLTSLLPLILMFVVFYFLLIRPQQKKMKDHQEMLKNLKRGDQIITNGGLVGKITGLTEKMVTLEVAEKIRVRILRSHIAGKQADMDSISTEKK